MTHRVPVLFHPVPAGPADALFIEGTHFHVAAHAHAAGCSCCTPRNEAGRALAALLAARARSQVPFFTRVIVRCLTAEGTAMVEAALADDPVASSCFRKV